MTAVAREDLATDQVRIRVRLFAGAAEAVGASELATGAATLGELVEELVATADDPAARGVLSRCSFLVAGTRVDNVGSLLPPGVVVDVLPPFAGG